MTSVHREPRSGTSISGIGVSSPVCRILHLGAMPTGLRIAMTTPYHHSISLRRLQPSQARCANLSLELMDRHVRWLQAREVGAETRYLHPRGDARCPTESFRTRPKEVLTHSSQPSASSPSLPPSSLTSTTSLHTTYTAHTQANGIACPSISDNGVPSSSHSVFRFEQAIAV